jgi:hypothetical protein
MKIPKKDTRPPVKVFASVTAEQYDLLTVQAMKGGYSSKELTETVLKTWLGTVRATPEELATAAALNAKSDMARGIAAKAKA